MNSISALEKGLYQQISTDLKNIGTGINSPSTTESSTNSPSGKSFVDYLKDNINEVNEMQKIAKTKATDIATGKSHDIHESMLASTQADLSFTLMMQIRNKALEAYQEIIRTPV